MYIQITVNKACPSLLNHDGRPVARSASKSTNP